MSVSKRCGYVAIVGRPNVGKSTLLNYILGQKISITSRKPQTTRHRILGIKTVDNTQIIYVDTPGIHIKQKTAMNRYLNKAAKHAISDVDVVIFVIDKLAWTDEDEKVFHLLQTIDIPVILVINKVDRITEKQRLLPHMQMLSTKIAPVTIVPLSARTGDNVPALTRAVEKHLPETNFFFFPPEQSTDRNEQFLASELVREKLVRMLGEELPYAMTVAIEQFKPSDKKDLWNVSAVIWVERESQKGIVIGAGGQRLREVGRQARLDMEKLFGYRIYLELWVKVRSNWRDDVRALAHLGYVE